MKTNNISLIQSVNLFSITDQVARAVFHIGRACEDKELMTEAERLSKEEEHAFRRADFGLRIEALKEKAINVFESKFGTHEASKLTEAFSI
ncbi:hypothetical protein [Vibrio barjaei]|uniref:hypothetical protein n=1 Tax=Vibrio barjaei TaxID=1676683 RepID=UPI002284BBE7|nr:hypothetical protein [Vibrio barjaei]MCY9874789.1 hypothetical protein [Vibrio barjaei]